ncbi:hypothetical protein BD309DRAFT_960631 [Dichomitus squalens]|nr:hypothetical protein BD309DRAFT_960631 [Dichomitus squalens]
MVLSGSQDGGTLIITNSQNLSYSEVACVALLTWDVVITLSDEVELIWKRRWTAAKVMYLIARYLPWLVQLALLAINVNGTTGLSFTSGQCAAWQIVQGTLLQAIVTSVDVILIIRVYALYHRNRILLIGLGSLFSAEVASLCYILVKVTPRLTYNDECYVVSSPSIFQYYWVVSLAFETLLFTLTIGKFLDGVRQGWGRAVMVQQFVADGTWAYALIFLTMLVNMMFYKYVHSELTGICYTWLLVVLSFAGSRLVLNPRVRAAPPDVDLQSDIELASISTQRRRSVFTGEVISLTLEHAPRSPASEKTGYVSYREDSEVASTIV